MIIKKKSRVVALISSFIICCVLVLTLVGYLAYLELKDNELKSTYYALLGKINAKIYARHIGISDLGIAIETYGPLKGKPVLAGVLKNTGYREVSDILLRVRFLDRDGAVIYEVVLRPQEPSLGYSGISQVTLPYLTGAQKAVIKRGGSLAFKKILSNCPKEILSELSRISSVQKNREAWSGRIEPEILSVGL